MLITPRTYQQAQIGDRGTRETGGVLGSGWQVSVRELRDAQIMLLVHQTGSVRIGEVIRYSLTYTPSLDRILPSPPELHVKVKNSSAIPLRAAYLHGPYTLYAACYPASFNPNYKPDSDLQDGAPDFEPNLKAGGSWTARLRVPERIRETAGKANTKRATDGGVLSATWIIEISSQIIFSTSPAVNFELLVGRDEKMVDLGTQLAIATGNLQLSPGNLQDHQQGKRSNDNQGATQSKGVFSKAIDLTIDDTVSLWNKPALPAWDDEGGERGEKRDYPDPGDEDAFQIQGEPEAGEQPAIGKAKPRKRKKVHLVVLTHGLHSNLGSDMLYLKENIDTVAKQARQDARKRKAKRRASEEGKQQKSPSEANMQCATRGQDSQSGPLGGGQDDLDYRQSEDSEDEEVIVRGFAGNAVRTERGIQYLGKRLAKYVLAMTYPDQPYLPTKSSVSKKLSRVLTGSLSPDKHLGQPAHPHSTVHRAGKKPEDLAYKISSISFIGHSLGGLTQTYAIAYIHKHSPQFFDEIRPINFIAMASPFLGLSNENPIYVKFALDFGLVGRTGQDLGLTWRAPTMVRSGWGAMIGGIGSEGQRAQRNPDPQSKPLLRILPTGPAHQVLKKFRNRTLYSNVVNDGIVPLRTSCLLFLDWRGLGRVEKARRENGLVGTMAGWGWAEITGANSSGTYRLKSDSESSGHGDESPVEGNNTASMHGEGDSVPQPSDNATEEDTTIEGQQKNLHSPQSSKRFEDEELDAEKAKSKTHPQSSQPFASIFSFLKPAPTKSHHHSPKHTKIYKRSQIKAEDVDGNASATSPTSPVEPALKQRPKATRGDSIMEDPENLLAPPKTTFFESAGDILNPPLPTKEFLIDPSTRPRTIFHDRVYHPEDIPPPPTKRQGRSRTGTSDHRLLVLDGDEQRASSKPDLSAMKVEEKIARAYHRDLSWRKVLVRLEPDAHNNMVVRRMFANAYGWPVIKHLCDTHFSDTYAAVTADKHEDSDERAKPMREGVGEHGEEVTQLESLDQRHQRTDSERRENRDTVPDLKSASESGLSSANNIIRPTLAREDSISSQWDDAFFEGSDSEDEIDSPVAGKQRSPAAHAGSSQPSSPQVASGTRAPETGVADPENTKPEDIRSGEREDGEDGKEVEGRKMKLPILSTATTTVMSGSTVGVGLRKPVGEQMAPG